MISLRRLSALTLLSGSAMTAIIWACGTPPPQNPPPPPPAPPVVCCVVVAWKPDPTNPLRECLIVRYFRQDGLPLFVSNPMPLTPNQQCLCTVPNLPSDVLAAGVVATELTFGGSPPCDGIPPNVPGYGPFVNNNVPTLLGQVNQFYIAYANASGPGTVMPPKNPQPHSLWTFSGPGTIPPGQTFDVYQKISIPRGFDPRRLCTPGQMWMIGLFLVQDGQVLAEPIAPGLAPIPIGQFQTNPGQSAFYKFKWYPLIVPPPCPEITTCYPNCDASTTPPVLNALDFACFLARYRAGCP